jgi:DNA-binding MarR family transcriptional regulator
VEKNSINPEIIALETGMTITVLNRTWEIEVWPAGPKQAPNAVYLQVRHKPAYGRPDLLSGGIRFGLTEAEVHRIAHALIEATTDGRESATDILRSLRDRTEKAEISSPPAPQSIASTKCGFTKTQGRYLAFIHRYITKFGRAPAESDIQNHFLVSAPSVNAMMQTLTKKGFISRIPGVARSIQLRVPAHLLPGAGEL